MSVFARICKSLCTHTSIRNTDFIDTYLKLDELYFLESVLLMPFL